MKTEIDIVKKYKLAGEDKFREPNYVEGEHFELSSGLSWIQHIINGEEISRVNTDYVVEIVWEIKGESVTLPQSLIEKTQTTGRMEVSI
jgi:predicted transposase YbfD/YdcC